MLIYVNITEDRQTDRQTHQKYSSEPEKKIKDRGEGTKKK